ncbi:hypothetical protein ACVQ92_03230 [Staphylococcus aureus]
MGNFGYGLKIGLSKLSDNIFMKIAENPELNVLPLEYMGACIFVSN